MALLKLREGREATVKVLEAASDGSFRFEAVVSEADYINANRRMYPQAVLFPAFERVNIEIERHPGTVDHPDPWAGVSVTDLGIAWESFRFEGSLVVGTGRIIQTAKGKDLQAAMEAGVAVGFSTRGRGAGEEQNIAGSTIYVLDSFNLDTVDAVVDPSVRHARIRSFTKEEIEEMDEKLTQALEAKGAAEAKTAEVTTQLEAANARVAELEGTVAERDATIADLNTRVETLETEAAERTAQEAADALEARLVALTSEHRFGPAIRQAAKDLNVTLDTAEAVVATVTKLIESAATASASGDEGTPRGDLSTNEDTETDPADPKALSADELAELEGTGLI